MDAIPARTPGTVLSKEEIDKLIVDHIPLAHRVAYYMATSLPKHVDRGNIRMAGELGLVEAASRFDPDRGYKFSTFAKRRIRGAILDEMRRNDWVPRSVRVDAREIEKHAMSLSNKLKRTPSNEELAEGMGITVARLQYIKGRVSNSSVLGLDRILTDDGDVDISFADLAVGEYDDVGNDLEEIELAGYLKAAVALLPDNQRFVIEQYFLKGMNSPDIAAQLDVSESRVSQIRHGALEALRHVLEGQYPETTLSSLDKRTAPVTSARYQTPAQIKRQDGWIDTLRVASTSSGNGFVLVNT